jgi:hypothetical protein
VRRGAVCCGVVRRHSSGHTATKKMIKIATHPAHPNATAWCRSAMSIPEVWHGAAPVCDTVAAPMLVVTPSWFAAQILRKCTCYVPLFS